MQTLGGSQQVTYEQLLMSSKYLSLIRKYLRFSLAVVLTHTETMWFLCFQKIFNLMVGIYSWYSIPLLRIGLICQENRRSNITILTSNNKIILYFTSFTTFRQSNYGQIKIKSNSWISNFKKMSGGMSTDNKEVLFPKTNRSTQDGFPIRDILNSKNYRT